MLRENLGPADRFIRILAGLVFFAIAVSGVGGATLTIVAYAFAATLFVTAALSACPLYLALRLNTCPVRPAGQRS